MSFWSRTVRDNAIVSPDAVRARVSTGARWATIVVVACVLAGYAAVRFSNQAALLKAWAHASVPAARAVAQAIGRTPGPPTAGAGSAFAEATEAGVRLRVIDPEGKVVRDEGDAPGWPRLTRSTPLSVSAVAGSSDPAVWRIEASGTLRPLLAEIGVMIVLSLCSGIALDRAVRVRPLRDIDHVLDELAQQNARFDAALNNMSQGLCFFDESQRLIVCNRRYAQMYGVAPERVRPGVTLREVVDLRFEAGSCPRMTRDEYLAWRRVIATADQPSDSVVELENGKVFEIRHRPMAGRGWVATHEDITERRRAEEAIAHMAHHDSVTDLPNRVLFRAHLDEAVERARGGDAAALLYLDLDRFKHVNDTLGHPIGDALLRGVAERLRACAAPHDVVARLGGDEFAIIQTAAEQPGAAGLLAAQLVQKLRMPFEVGGHQVVIGTSVGIAVAPRDGADPDGLLKAADMALYHAKDTGRGQFCFFDAEMYDKVQQRRSLELDIRQALAEGQMTLVYQPFVDLTEGRLIGCEALMRWTHPIRGMIPPSEFIPLAEEIGLISALGEWALREACAEAATWPPGVKVAVNISPKQFKGHKLVQTVLGALARSGLAAERLELEITETVILEKTASCEDTLHRLRDLGVKIALDDFGIGYSSLSYLRAFPFDKIKIDGSFVHDVARKPDCRAIIRAVAELGASLGMTTVAEGVETEEQVEILARLGCRQVQGCLVSPPRPASEIAQMLPAQARRLDPAA